MASRVAGPPSYLGAYPSAPGDSDLSPSGVTSLASTESTMRRARVPRMRLQRQSADGEDLIRPERRVQCSAFVIDVHHIGQVAGWLGPEARRERAQAARKEGPPARIDCRGELERVQPERLDFDRLADSRCDHTIANSRVHPRQLLARHAGSQQCVIVHPDPEARACAVTAHDRQHRSLERHASRRSNRQPVRARGTKQFVDGDYVPERPIHRVELGCLSDVRKTVWQHALGDGICPLQQNVAPDFQASRRGVESSHGDERVPAPVGKHG